ncbi:MAG: hypothetical protein FJW35_09305 [Acidobacteria bacterium]|nr:hypothetical protein [Acidobacteriota bacterium]
MIGFIFAVSILAAAAAAPQQPSTRSPYAERERREFAFYPGGKVEVTAGVPGNLVIEGWDRASVVLETEKIVYYLPADRARELAGQSSVRLRHTQTSAVITAQGPDKASVGLEINLKLYVPGNKTDLKIKGVRGDLQLRGINGWVEANLEQGSIEAIAMQGYFSAVTREGDIIAEMSGIRWLGQGFNASTLRGAIELRLPVPYSAAAQLETRDGKITVDYPEQVVEGEKVPLLVAVKKKSQSLSARVGDGGAPVRIHTQAGNVHISAASPRRQSPPQPEPRSYDRGSNHYYSRWAAKGDPAHRPA